jgi:hypothetical protein
MVCPPVGAKTCGLNKREVQYEMRISAPFGIFFCLFLPLISLPADVSEDHVYQCVGPSGTALYTDRDRPGCQAMALASLAIAPSRAYSVLDGKAAGNFLRPFPEDWFDNTTPVGSMRNRMLNGGLSGSMVRTVGSITMPLSAPCGTQ